MTIDPVETPTIVQAGDRKTLRAMPGVRYLPDAGGRRRRVPMRRRRADGLRGTRIVEVVPEAGRRGAGEATALPGYADETDEQIARAIESALPHLAGRIERNFDVVATSGASGP